MSRERKLSEAFVGLADTLGEDYDVIDLFERLAHHCAALTSADAAGIMISDGRGGLRAVAASSQSAAMIELMQVQTGRGPCVQSYLTGRPAHATDLARLDPRWPELAPVAQRAGFRAAHTVPLRLRRRVLGAVNLFYTRPGPAADGDLRLAQALADVAALAMLHEPVAQYRAEDLLGRLQATLTHKAAMEQAKGVLAVRGGLSIEEAGLALRLYAHRRRQPVTDVARALVRGNSQADRVLSIWADSGREARMPEALELFHSPILCCRVSDFGDDSVVIEVAGDLDASTSPELDAVLAAYVGAGPRLVLDLSGVEFIDCTTLRVMQSAHQTDDRLLLVAPSPAVLRLLELTAADLPYYDSFEQALDSLGSPSTPPSP